VAAARAGGAAFLAGPCPSVTRPPREVLELRTSRTDRILQCARNSGPRTGRNTAPPPLRGWNLIGTSTSGRNVVVCLRFAMVALARGGLTWIVGAQRRRQSRLGLP